MHAAGAMDLVKPFALLAAVAFVVGFLGYIAVGRPDTAEAQARPVFEPAAASGPASAEWNLPKHI